MQGIVEGFTNGYYMIRTDSRDYHLKYLNLRATDFPEKDRGNIHVGNKVKLTYVRGSYGMFYRGEKIGIK